MKAESVERLLRASDTLLAILNGARLTERLDRGSAEFIADIVKRGDIERLRTWAASGIKLEAGRVDACEFLGRSLEIIASALVEGIGRLPPSGEIRELLGRLLTLQVEIAEAGFPSSLDESDVS